jgi:hypothetical protein
MIFDWAESSAAPTFGEMAKFMLDYFGVEPTEEYTQNQFLNHKTDYTKKQYVNVELWVN